MIKRYGDTILVVLPDDTAFIEAPSDTDPELLAPAYKAALELGYLHGDTVHLADQCLDVTLLTR